MSEPAATPTARGRTAALGIPASALTALPACPACYPAYAGILSSLGLSGLIDPGAQRVLTAVFLAVVVGALAFRARRRRGHAPLVLGLVGAIVLLAAKFGLDSSPLTYGGAGILVAATLWNAWPRKAPGAACSSCSPAGHARSRAG